MAMVRPQRRHFTSLIALLAGLALATLSGCAALPGSSGARIDETPRVAVMSAFPAELTLLREELDQPRSFWVNGVEFSVGLLEGKPVVMFLSGVSMTNAAMTTQLALDRFKVSHI